jgi:ABC-2 type transport system permease protein
MAIYKRTYKGYEGSLTPAWSRFLVLPRFAYESVFSTRLTGLLVAACFPPLGFIAMVYLANNLDVLLKLAPGNIPDFLKVNADLFLNFMNIQGFFAFIITSIIGPGLVSPDLVNGGLPLYLCRPFTRTEYVLGKLSVLLILLSAITWIPGLLLFAVQVSLAPSGWFQANWAIGTGLFFGFWIWILLISLLALALSAWIRWRVAAGGAILGVFFVGGGIGAAINGVLRVQWGSLFDLSRVIDSIWSDLMGHDPGDAAGIQPLEAWIAASAVCALCLFLLERKIRAKEVVR